MAQPRKKKIYDLYILWLALPPMFSEKGEIGFDALGIKDDFVRELCYIKTKKAFAEKYGINKDTITAWDKRIDINEPLLVERRKWLSRVLGNVLGAVYRKVLIDGDASKAKFLAQYAGEFTEEFRGIDSDKVTDIRITFEGGLDEPVKSPEENKDNGEKPTNGDNSGHQGDAGIQEELPPIPKEGEEDNSQ